MATAKFTNFPLLPSELRLKILHFCCATEARIVPIRFNRTSKQYITTTQPSSLLAVSKLARETYLETHTNLILSPKYPSAIFLNLSQDTILFDTLDCSPDGDLALDLASGPQRLLIQRIAIAVELWEVLRVFRWDALSEIRSLGGLKIMALVLLREGRELGRPGNEVAVMNVADDGGETVGEFIRQSLWYVENLKMELEKSVQDDSGIERNWQMRTPSVQLWLW